MARPRDHLVECPHEDCRFPNRSEAMFCAQCGRLLGQPQAELQDHMAAAALASRPSRTRSSGFLTAPGGPVTRLDGLADAFSWCLAFAGLAILLVTMGVVASRLLGF